MTAAFQGIALPAAVDEKFLAYAALFAVVGGNVLGNLFMKLGAQLPEDHLHFFKLFGWPTLVGLAFYGSGVLLYAWALKHVALHTAQAIVILQFAGAILLSAFFFREIITTNQWAGIGFIVLGLIICVR